MNGEWFRNSAHKEDAAPREDTDLLTSAVAAVGDVAYRWLVQEDRIIWGGGAELLLGVSDAGSISSNRIFVSRIVSQNGSGRHEIVAHSRAADSGAGVAYELEYQVRDDFGGLRWIEDRGRWFADSEGRPAVATGMLRSIDDRRMREDRLVRLSTYDELTGLLNRVQLKEMLNEVLIHAQHGRAGSAFILLAIDNLTLINDAFGFDVADEVIIGIGQRLRTLARRGDSIGRYAGNKFGIVLKNCSDERLSPITERLLAAVRNRVIETSRGPVAATVSAGCLALPCHASNVDMALARAEEALTAAKQMRRDSFVIYTPSRERERTRLKNINVADELVAALNERRIRIAYQPVVTARTGEVVMHECLIRLQQTDGTIVDAGSFVPVAEKLGLIGLLDHRAMELAVKTLIEHPRVRLSLNVSGRTAGDRLWIDTLVSRLYGRRDLASRLVVEITETVAIHDIADSAEFITTLRDLGCLIAIDDFGAGYTSFRNLKALDVDMVKIDGSFVQDLVTSPDNQFFVRTLVELARNFNLPTVAEWVSNAEEVAMLRDFGVEYLQGFYLGEPMLELPRDARTPATVGVSA